MKLLWATRGRDWGFKILAHPAGVQPLAAYRSAFAGIGDEYEAFLRTGARAAVRFPDPEQRRDRAGRVIPHEFIVLDELAAAVEDLQSARSLVWPEVAAVYSRIWDQAEAPAAGSIELR